MFILGSGSAIVTQRGVRHFEAQAAAALVEFKAGDDTT